MTYKIPSDEEVVTAIQRIILKHHTIVSQHKLKNMVEEELRTLDDEFRVSGSRIRRLVLKSKYFHLEIDYKQPPKADDKKDLKSRSVEATKQGKRKRKPTKPKKPQKEKKLRACPVCGSKVKKIQNKTLKGGFITTGYRCTACPYHTGLPVRLPARYVFSIRRL
jgi:hypothetical protein